MLSFRAWELCQGSAWGEAGFWGAFLPRAGLGLQSLESGRSTLQKHQPHHCDDHEEPSQDADADEDDVAGVLAPDFTGIDRFPLPLLGIHQVFCLAQPGRIRASNKGH